MPRTLRALTATAALVAAAPSVRAQEGKALAEALFRDGRELMADGKVHEACSKFAMSQRIEPKLGTLLNLASCNEADGKIASAWAQFTEARAIAERTGQAEREQFAREHADALSTRLSRITVASADGSELSLQLDGVMIDAAVAGTAFPVDPGEHSLKVTSPGKKAWTTTISVPVTPGTTSVMVPALERDAAPPPIVPVAVEPRTPPAAVAQRDRPLDTRVAGVVVTGAGAFAIGLGSFFGVRAFAKKADSEGHCSEGSETLECDPEGDRLLDDSEASAHASTVAFAAGLVAVGVGVYLLLRKPSPPPRAAGPARPRFGSRGAYRGFDGRGVSLAW